MNVAQRERERALQFERLLPGIAAALSRGDSALDVARDLERDAGVDLQEGYRWIQLTEEEVERFRRRRALIAVLPVWVLGIAATLGGLMLLGDFGLGRTAATFVLTLGALLLAAVVAVLAWRRGKDPWASWLAQRGRLQEK